MTFVVSIHRHKNNKKLYYGKSFVAAKRAFDKQLKYKTGYVQFEIKNVRCYQTVVLPFKGKMGLDVDAVISHLTPFSYLLE